MAVTWDQLPSGSFRISREFRCIGAAAAGAKALSGVVEAAFEPPQTIPEGVDVAAVLRANPDKRYLIPAGRVPEGLASAIQRDVVPADDDEGEAIPGQCRTVGGCE